MSKASLFSKLAAGEGNLIPDSDEGRDLGSASKKWKDLYLSGSSLILGNVTLKDSGGSPTFVNAGGNPVKIDLSAMTTADLAEHTNFPYFSNTRARSAFSIHSGARHYDSATGVITIPETTDHITEGSNLYYTNTRVETVVNPMIDSAVNALVNGAPGQLNTLDELAAALNDDSDFANTVTANIATKLAIRHDITVTVASGTNQYGSGNKYHFEGVVSPYLHLQPGRTYRFDQSDASNSGHPLRFSTNPNNSPSATYSTGVTVVGTPGSAGAYTEIAVTAGTPPLHYYCTNHSGMGGSSPAGSIFDGQWSSLTGTPTTISGYGITDAFDGAFSSLSGTPTTISGYGITDAFDGQYSSLTGAPTTYAWSTITSTPTTISGYGITDAQATLVSGTNIKTINGNTLLGSGDLVISGGGSGGTDSATVSAIILADVDSAYVQARQSGGGSGISLAEARAGISVTTGSASGGGTLSYDNTTGVLTFQPSTNTGGGGLISGGVKTYVYTADSAQTVFSGADSSGDTLQFTGNNIVAYLNGVLLQRSADYNLSNENTLTLTFDAATGDEISIVSFDPTSTDNLASYFDSNYITSRVNSLYPARGSVENFFYTAAEGQLTFSGNDANGNPLQFSQDNKNVLVSVNGVLLIQGTDYTTSASTNTLTLVDSASAGDQIYINTFSTLFKSTGLDSADMEKVIDSDFITSRISGIYPITNAVTTFKFTSDSGQSTFTGADSAGNTLLFDSQNISVFLNGIYLQKYADYTTSGGNSITVTPALDINQDLVIQNFTIRSQAVVDSSTILGVLNDGVLQSQVDSAYITQRMGAIYGGARSVDKFFFTSTEGQSTFTGTDSAGNTLYFTSGAENVFLNGIYLQSGLDYSTSGTGSITILDSLNAGQKLIVNNFDTKFAVDLATSVVDSSYVIARIPRHSANANIDTFKFTTATPVTSISGNDSAGNTLSFDSDAMLVFYNGINLIKGDDFTTTGNTINLTTSTDSGGEIAVYSFDKYFQTQLSSIDSAYVTARIPQYGATSTVDRYRFVATANQTVFSGTDADGGTLSYTANQIQVFLNGILLTPTTDYTASNGTSITLTDPASAGFEIIVYDYTKQFNVNVIEPSSVNWQIVTSTPFTAPSNSKLIVNTSSAKTINLPASPSLGNQIRIVDGDGTASINNITISSSDKIVGSDSDLIIDINDANIELVYYNATRGWILTDK